MMGQLSFTQWLLVGATVLMFIALLLPWWSVTAVFLGTFSLDGFHSWGWLSFVAWLVILFLDLRLIVGDRLVGPSVSGILTTPMTARSIVVAGVAELIGNFLFIAVAPSGSGAGYSAGIGAGVIIAIICGLAVTYAGLLLTGVAWLPKPKWIST